MHPLNVIIKPIVSEKSTDLRDTRGKYTFQVQLSATKADIKSAVFNMWGAEVESVATMIRRGKIKRRGKNLTKPKNTKRAVVSLKGDVKLPLFEDQ